MSELKDAQIKLEPPETSEISELSHGAIKKETEEEGAVDFGDADEDDNLDEALDGTTWYEDSGFKIKQINEPQVVRRSIGDLHRLSLGKYLVLDTKYQRSMVWDDHRASTLIASILQHYYIPPVVFNVKYVDEPDPENEGNMIQKCWRYCVDGKQRLTSIGRFMEGYIGISDNAVPQKKWFYCHPKVNGVEQPSGHLILPENTKKLFRERDLVTYEYSDLSIQVEETMFQLVQKGMPLTPAERMRALSTDWAKFAKEFEADFPKIINLCTQKRASGFRCLIVMFGQIIEVLRQKNTGRLLHIESPGRIPKLQSSVQSNFRLLQDNQSLNEGIKATCKEIFNRFQKLVDICMRKSRTGRMGVKIILNSAFDPRAHFLVDKGVGHVKSFSPLELLATAILILVHSNTRSDEELLDDIKELRIYLRKEYKDLRLNGQCWGTAWQYIDSEMKNHLAVDAHRVGESDTDEVDSMDSDDTLEQVVALAKRETETRRQVPKPPRTSSANTAPNSPSTNGYSVLGGDRASENHNSSASKKRRLDF